MNTCYLVGGGDFDGFFDKLDKSDYVIGADKGYENLLNLGIKADLVIGDFDSAKEPSCKEKIKLNPEKDVTDTYAGIEIGLKKGYKNFIIYGGLGGRLSHTLANIKIAHEFKKKGINIVLKSKKQRVFLVDKTFKKSFKSSKNYYVSIFSLAEVSYGLNIKGLKYELEDYTLSIKDHLGVSNETIGKDFEISVKKGLLLIVFEDTDI